MKAILEFNLDDADDIRSHERCVKAEDMALILWEIQYNMKEKMEHQTTKFDAVDFFYDWLNDEMSSRGISIDKLII